MTINSPAAILLAIRNGYHYGFVVTFATPQARDAYLDDENHRPVAEAIGAAAERIVVFDI